MTMRKEILEIFFFSVLSCLRTSTTELEIKSFNITENCPINTTIDFLSPKSITKYSYIKIIGDGFQHYFHLHKVNGKIYVIRTIDLESSELCVQNQHCCDQNNDCKFVFLLRLFEHSSTATVTYKLHIFVDDANDWPPKFKQEQHIVEFREGTKAVGEKQLLPIAFDRDFSRKNRQLKYRIKTNEENINFFQLLTDIENRTPMLLLLGALNCEVKNHFLIDLIASDSGNKEGRLLVYVKVLDVNEFSPEFSKNLQTIHSLSESTPINTVVLKVNATDNDAYPNNNVTFELETINDLMVSKTFSIDSNNGDLVLISELDYEKSRRYSLIIIASDSAPRSERRSSSISINISILDVNDNYPEMKFESENQRSTITENQPIGTAITILKINDRDLNQNGDVTCMLKSTETNFILHRIVEKFYQIESNKIFDRESTDKYFVVIRCNDHGSPSLTTTATLTVVILDENDQAPQFIKGNFHFKVKENSASKSFLKTPNNDVAKLQVSDRDLIGNLTFYLDPTDIIENLTTAIDIEVYTGVLYSVHALDRESVSELRMKICCNDSIHVTCVDVYVAVEDENDNAPFLVNEVIRLTIEENTITYDKPLLTFHPRDLDVSNLGFKYQFNPTTVGDVYKYFQLENEKLFLRRPIDREEISAFQFLVQIADNHPRSDKELYTTAKVYVTVLDQNDNVPQFLFPNFTHYSINMSCHEPIGHLVTKVTAADPDNSENGTVVYELVNILPKKELGLFHVDRQTGEIFINSPALSERFCRLNFVLMISAKDLGDQYLKNENYKKFFSKAFGKLQITLLDIPRSYSARITHITPRLILTVILSCSTLFLICLLIAWAFIIFCQRQKDAATKDEEEKPYYSMNMLNNSLAIDQKVEQDDECQSDRMRYIHPEYLGKYDSFSEPTSSFRPTYCTMTPTIFINPSISSSGNIGQGKPFHYHVRSNRSHSNSNTPPPSLATLSSEETINMFPIQRRRTNSSTINYEPLYILRGHHMRSPPIHRQKVPETMYSTALPHPTVVKFRPTFTNRNEGDNYSDTYV